MEQLKELQLEMASPSSFKLCEDKYSVIPLITIKQINSINKKPEESNEFFPVKNLTASSSQDRFWRVLGTAELDKEGFLAKHIGGNWDFVCILGQQLYSQGQHVVRFKIEQIQYPDSIYFGCISSQLTDDLIGSRSPFAVGWFGTKDLYQHGVYSGDCNSQDRKLKSNDILCLIFDCDNRQIKLFHERINKTYEAPVNIDKSPFPWQFLMVFYYNNDCVRILSN